MSKAPGRILLRQWMWRAFMRSALIPLILVETVLVGCYLLTNQAIRDAQLGYLDRSANQSLAASAEQNARIIENQLKHIGDTASLLARLTTLVLQTPTPATTESLAISPQGARFSPVDRGGAASFYSSATPLARQDLAKVSRLASLDPMLKEIKDHDATIASLYFNSWDSYNRIYPWFRTDEQYPDAMRIPDFNFYYLADQAHNPGRTSRWTDVYLDPAGHGWMMSAVAPVYAGDFLEGVVGIDVTIGGILPQLEELKVPWDGYLLLVGRDGTIMAMPKKAEHDFDLQELIDVPSKNKLSSEHFKPQNFNLMSRNDTRELAARLRDGGADNMQLSLKGREHLVAWSAISSTGWHLLAVVDKENVMSATNALAAHYRTIGYLMIGGLVVFYLAYFSVLWVRSRRLSERLRQTIAEISSMLREIGSGHWQPARARSQIQELDQMAGDVLTMGGQLATSELHRRMAQERLMLIMDSPTSGMWEFHLDDDCLSLHGGLCKRLGWASNHISREAFLEKLDAQSASQFQGVLDRLRSGLQQRIEVELRVRKDDGSALWLLCQGQILDVSFGTNRTALGTLVDIDMLKLAEADLKERTHQAQAANQAKSRFISSISHELRTPLNAIHGFGQLLQLQVQDAVAKDQAQEILAASSHLTTLVDDLLDWSSLQAEPQHLSLISVQVVELLEHCCEMMAPQAMAAGLELQLSPMPRDWWVHAEPRRLRQVILNLLSNAIKYNRPGGKLLVGAELLPGVVRLYVEDGGMGIEPELQAELFEPFQRLGKENTSIQGTGIGLALCRELASLMGGSMGLRSIPGEGSRFWIELLDATLLECPQDISDPLVFYAGRDLDIITQLPALLHGHTRFEHGTLEACLDQAREQGAPTVLLLDCDGDEAPALGSLARIRRTAGAECMSLVLIGSQPRKLALLGVEFQGVLAKPVAREELAELLRALLEQESSDVH
ncbi:PAS domain S-box protein [Pseudomonas sp. NY5710]|uniref:sensor histidine kinase n=1 Tax=Pseudomonas sp. NY5710 TaxID=2662033 RepID=UPI00157120E5|nr:ATP-binding protein [Pseudomonas sp. NY5710]QKL00790.1 PAS domain S-box protein [Pseudomonas sp. NY5710]